MCVLGLLFGLLLGLLLGFLLGFFARFALYFLSFSLRWSEPLSCSAALWCWSSPTCCCVCFHLRCYALTWPWFRVLVCFSSSLFACVCVCVLPAHECELSAGFSACCSFFKCRFPSLMFTFLWCSFLVCLSFSVLLGGRKAEEDSHEQKVSTNPNCHTKLPYKTPYHILRTRFVLLVFFPFTIEPTSASSISCVVHYTISVVSFSSCFQVGFILTSHTVPYWFCILTRILGVFDAYTCDAQMLSDISDLIPWSPLSHSHKWSHIPQNLQFHRLCFFALRPQTSFGQKGTLLSNYTVHFTFIFVHTLPY